MEQSSSHAMNEQRALAIVSALADGVNPITGELFPPDSPYQHVHIVRALVLVTRALESKGRTRPRANMPSNAGKPWDDSEDERLLREFDRGEPAERLAELHGRTVAGIQARLERHGRIKPGEGSVNQTKIRWQQRPQQRGGASAPR